MKKVLILIFIVATGISSCKKDDKSVFDKSPDERLNEKLAEYQSQLSGAQNGWKGFITTDSGRGASFNFYFKFNNENRVMMLSDFDSLSAVTLKESSYRLKALQQPSLVFDTYSYLHVLADPDETVNGGTRGAGFLSDFEFYFDSTTTDTLKLVGRINGSKLLLVRASQAEEIEYNNGALSAGLVINKILTYFKRLTIGGELYDMRINPVTRQIIFSWLDASGAPHSFTTNFYFNIEGIFFTTPFETGSRVINGFTAISFDPGSQIITLKVSNETATIKGIVVPLVIDIPAPRRWYTTAQNAKEYWLSINGFHVNGVEDAYKVNSLTSGNLPYVFYIYQPKYAPNVDLFAPIFLNTAGTDSLVLDYGAAPRIPAFTLDGRVIFSELGEFGTYPTSGPAVQTRDNLYAPQGYYFVQTGDNTYDMVSATDGKSWISWRRF